MKLTRKNLETPALIELKIETVQRLFHAMDPSPFTERDLDAEAEDFIVGWAREQSSRKPLELLIHLSEPISADMGTHVQTAIQNYFAYRRDGAARKLRHLIARGWLSLLIGLTFLALCLGAADLLRRYGSGPVFQVANYGLIIGGWVAMSRPLEIFLYEWWPIRHEQRIFDRLSHLQVQIRYGPLGRSDSPTTRAA